MSLELADTTEARGEVPAGIVAAVAILAGLAGTLLWAHLLLGPFRLAAGLLEAGTHLEAAENKLSSGSFSKARYETLAATAAASRARSGLEGPLLDLLEITPPIGDALGTADHLVAAAEHSADAARGALDVAEGALKGATRIIAEDPGDPKSSIVRLDRVEALAERISSIRASVLAAKRELEAVDLAALPARVRPELAKGLRRASDADRRLADAEAGFELLPAILGSQDARNYLIGSQNSSEQRGTGGAILQYSLVEIDAGRLSIQDSRTVYEIDRDRTQLDIPLPEEAFYVREIDDAKRFGNANWSPDWPRSAELMIDYATAADRELPRVDLPAIDGFIAVDPIALQELMPGVGPYKVRGKDRIKKNSVVDFILYRAYGEYPAPWRRREVLKLVVDRFVHRAVSDPRATALLEGTSDALAHKHVQIWMSRPAEQAFIERMNWDGAIEDAAGTDYLYVVEQNVGGNKLDYFAENSTMMDIELSGDDSIVSTTMTAHNGVFMPQPRRILGDRPDSERGLHFPLMNLYVPENAILENASHTGRLDSNPFGPWTGGRPPEHSEGGKKVWSATLTIPPNEERSVTFDYRVPGVVQEQDGRKVYRLTVQHQPRVNPETLTIRLLLPPEAHGIRARGWKVDGRELVWDRVVNEDMELEVSWRS